MHIKIVQYILSVVLLTCVAYKTSSTLMHAVSSDIEFFGHFSPEKETKEIEKLYEVEVFYQPNIFFFLDLQGNSFDFFDKKNSLPFRHFQLHYPPPNAIV